MKFNPVALFIMMIAAFAGCASNVYPMPDTTPPSNPDAGMVVADGQDSVVPTDPDSGPVDMTPPADGVDVTDANPATFTVALASTPSSSTVVRNSTQVPSVGLVFTAGPLSDVLITATQLTGVGDVIGTFAVSNFWNVVTSCALFDGATQVGLSASPDSTLGTMRITNMNLRVPRGTSRTLVARCSTDSVVALPRGDRYAIGVATATDVVAEDESGNPTVPVLASALIRNASYLADAVIITVLANGTLTITPDVMPRSTILVAGTDVWQNVAQYRATAQHEGVTITQANLASLGDSASFTQVAIAREGIISGRNTLLAGINQNRDILLTGTGTLTVPRDGSVTFQLWANVSSVVAWGTNPATSGIARSGAQIALGLNAGLETGEWDANYRGHLNVRATGAISGDRIYAAGAPMFGNTFVVRRSKPTVTQLAIPSTMLVPGDMDLYRFSVQADAAGSIALKRIRMSLVIHSGTGARVCNVRLRRGSTELRWPQDYQIIGPGAHIDPAQCWDPAWWDLVILLTEETVSGSGSAYTLMGTPEGFMTGDSLMIAFGGYTGGGDPGGLGGDIGVVTGYIRDLSGLGHSYDLALDLSPWNAPDSTMLISYYPGFMWSDLSEVPHSPFTGIMGGSRDWTNGYLVEDLTRTQILTR